MSQSPPPILNSPLPSILASEEHNWRPLRFLNLYRFFIAALLVILFQLEQLPPPLGSSAPDLFYYTGLAYVAFSLLAMYPLWVRKPGFLFQLSSHMLADIGFIVVLMHASGGVSSGVGMLLVISIANGSMIAAGRISGLFAALASLAVLGDQIYSAWFGNPAHVNYSLAGMLGFTLFATAILAHVLARRARESEALARQRGIDLANMAQLTEYIIQHMHTGVMVVAPDRRVRLINSAAWRLLGMPTLPPNAPLQDYGNDLEEQLRLWQRARHEQKWRINPQSSPHQVLVQCIPIGSVEANGALLFLEDAAATTQHAQQLKLASLGRLTASIAHEIRNPLGAISHAGALLAESPALENPDRRLTEIIAEQSQRINSIIENVLQLGRRDRTQAQLLTLNDCLYRFLLEFGHVHPQADSQIRLESVPDGLCCWFDPGHLHQILSNLCENGLRHGHPAVGRPMVRIVCGRMGENHGYIDVCDNGPGVPEELRSTIFEPFYTTQGKGTGLGLYLARELAECNQAQLRYEPDERGGSRFRLVFSSRAVDGMS
ncbi:MAG: sensor histidine kinase [Thiohalomonadaceae bacterium]